jgi:M6 family metalloprotease-like protein
MRFRRRTLLAGAAVALLAPAAAQADTLSGAQFNGLTEIDVNSGGDLAGIAPENVTITKPGGATVPASAITIASTSGNRLVVRLKADQFARTTSQGTTIATSAFAGHTASAPVSVARAGEPAANAHIVGSSQWTDNGWSTSLTDPFFHDPVTGQDGLYRFQDLTPNADAAGAPVVWNDGAVTTPAHRDLKMLVLFVQFPNRLATSSPAGWQTMQPYMDFLQPASAFWNTASYGQLNVRFDSPQASGNLGWITMDKNANLYTWDAQTHNMFAYSREAFQKAYDQYGIKADDYDEVLIMPARGTSGLANGPGNINRDPTDGEQTNTNQAAYVDHDGKTHYVSTVITAGNDMFSWGYRWINHEFGHTVGLPDLYSYYSTIGGTRVNQFFWVGGWNIMGNIGGHANDYSGIEKYKLRWLRDDQVDVVSQPGSSTHAITPLETPGGSKIVVIRTGVSTAYVAEFRTKLGVDGLDNRAKYQGVLLYRIDASQWEQFERNADLQVISKQYYNDPAVGGPLNKTGVWRPINTSLTGLDTQGALWGPGDTFEDPATGVRIDFGAIGDYLASNPANSPYTADDTATITVTKTGAASLNVPVALSDAKLTGPTTLSFKSSAELQDRITDSNSINNGHYVYVREGSRLTAGDVTLVRGDGSVVPASAITGVAITPGGVELTLAPGTFPTAASAQGLTVATKPFFSFGAGAATPVVPQLADVGGTVPATLSLTLSGPVSLGAFVPGTAKVYTASSTATVTSTAGDAALTATPAGRLTNGAFSLAQPLQVTALPATWTGPVSNDIVGLTFSQAIGAGEALRTGAYSTTVTFTLSTTTP